MLPNTVVVEAPAKVNLVLRVVGRRDDGYHDIESLVVPISLADRLQIHAYADPSQFRTLALSLEVEGDPRLVRRVPSDESNLALRAAAALAGRTEVRGFADVLLEKVIPVTAGLGGGSSDAAATLRALNNLWGCGLTPQELADVAAEVGSDIPAMLAGRPVMMSGRGERIESATAGPLRLALVTFDFGVSTPQAYRWWDEDGRSTGPDPRAAMLAAAQGDAEALGPLLFNDLEEPVMRRHPEIRAAKERLLEAGAMGALMCGSGPTVAGLLAPEAEIPGALVVTSLA
jgi:4-diphosphocytidyl-2-C-methyl-D-erythritol kinase